MPPQGESTGVAIEDGVLLAHVLSRRDTGRSVPQMLADYEALRRADVEALHKTSMARWNAPAPAGCNHPSSGGPAAETIVEEPRNLTARAAATQAKPMTGLRGRRTERSPVASSTRGTTRLVSAAPIAG